MEDEKIVQLIWDRNENGINELSEKYDRYCFCISERIVHDEEDAPHPSILAASSNSFGTPLKYPYIIQMENARLMVLYSSINPTCVSYKP